MLVIKNLSLTLTHDLRLLLNDFNFILAQDAKVALIGEEGNGKSTLLKCIAEPKTLESYLEIEGEINCPNEIIGYLPQSLSEEILNLGTKEYFDSKIDHELFDYGLFYRMIDEMEFPEDRISADIRICNLSGGEKIKLQLLCEMLKMPTLLLLDEPTNDLDLNSVRWLERFIDGLTIPVMFVSHDEVLLEQCANTIIHFEQLARKTKPFHTVARMSYEEYVANREARIFKQTRMANKEKAEYEAKMERYRQIYQRVHHEQQIVSRQDPSTAKNLKDKMHTVKSMGKRFERQKENMTEKPDFEESIELSFSEKISIPNGKRILDLQIEHLRVGNLNLSKDISLQVFGPEKLCIVGSNGSGKTTLLREILKRLKNNGIALGYMPQDYGELMPNEQNAIDFLARGSSKEEITKARTYLGSMNFTSEEMLHPLSKLSGGQRAKLFFSKMILGKSEVLVLDEPTRNLSPLSGPEIRSALKDFGGCIIAVSHDRKFISEVFDKVYSLDETGLWLQTKSFPE